MGSGEKLLLQINQAKKQKDKNQTAQQKPAFNNAFVRAV